MIVNTLAQFICQLALNATSNAVLTSLSVTILLIILSLTSRDNSSLAITESTAFKLWYSFTAISMLFQKGLQNVCSNLYIRLENWWLHSTLHALVLPALDSLESMRLYGSSVLSFPSYLYHIFSVSDLNL